jgi:hypothetical protein
MNAEKAREIQKSTIERVFFETNRDSNKIFETVLADIKRRATNGHRDIVLNMAALHYTVITRLLYIGYDIEDFNTAGNLVVKW